MKALGKGSVASVVKLGLDVAWVLLWVGAAGFCLAALAYGAISLLAETGLLADGPIELVEAEIRAGKLVLITEDGRVLDWRILVPVLLVGAVALAGSLAIVWRLKRLFRNFTSGEPFSAENAHHLRAIWIVLIAIELARYAIMAVFGVIRLSAGSPDRIRVDFDFNLTAWFLILIIIVLAEVFREGARLREDEKLTI